LRSLGAELRRQAQSGTVTEELLTDVHAAWGNESWSADVSYLSAVVARMLDTNEGCVECGCGLTTMVAGIIAETRGTTLFSLEQEEKWRREVAERLTMLNVGHVELWHTPLRDYGEFAWYDLADRTLPSQVSYVFCDGPAVGKEAWPAIVHSRWRMGVVPVLQERKVRFREILLDDGDDARAPELVAQWEGYGVRTKTVDTPSGPFVLGTPVG
jgi:hypothetical protein